MEAIRKSVMNNDYNHITYSNVMNKSIIITKRNKKSYSAAMARNRAGYLVKKLNNPNAFMYYLKCAWNLTDQYLDKVLEIALTKESPVLYFSKATAKEMRNNMAV